MMEGDEKIELVLGHTSKLRSKITDVVFLVSGKGAGAEEQDMEREDMLSDIQHALTSLEKELASLKDLYQQQIYDREAALAKIDNTRKKLLNELSKYQGEDLELIQEVATIACETNSTLLANRDSESQLTHLAHSPRQDKLKVLRSGLGFVVKSAVSFIGIASFLSLAGFKLDIRKWDASIHLLDLFHKTAGEEKEVPVPCPAGKILMIEDGKAHSVVKERVEIPFGSGFDCPNINFAFG